MKPSPLVVLVALLSAVAVANAGQASSRPGATTALPVNTSPASRTGRILFYMPLTSRSMKITFMPLAESLADRGHEVVVIMPHQAKAKRNLDVITVDSPFESKLLLVQ